jgi:hypothetical protein
MKVEIKCKRHPKYEVVLWPYSGCETCKQMYQFLNPAPDEQLKVKRLD